jgi:hypothetical protein
VIAYPAFPHFSPLSLHIDVDSFFRPDTLWKTTLDVHNFFHSRFPLFSGRFAPFPPFSVSTRF